MAKSEVFPPYEIPPHVAELIRVAAGDLLRLAPSMCDGSANNAVAALCLAASNAAALANLPYAEFIELVSAYYEASLLSQAEEELRQAGEITSLTKLTFEKN